LGDDIGVQHSPAKLQHDIAVLMDSLEEHEVYEAKGRIFADGDERHAQISCKRAC
jgi:hypothetical protein